MVLTNKTVDNRWIRRYRLFFIVGIAILSFQILLAVRFFTINGDVLATNEYVPHKIPSGEHNDLKNIKQTKNLVVFDDEDASNVYFLKSSTHKSTESIYKSNKSQLRLDELQFVPACEIKTKEAVSAIHRAQTQKCKQEIANITCLIKDGLLYPKYLRNSCPNNDLEVGKSLGCFKDAKDFRLLSGYYGNNKNENSPEYCTRLCLQSGFPYAGVQYSIECFCGNDEPPPSARLPDSSCNMKCPTDPHLACGGYFTINIYQTGIRKFAPQVAATEASVNEKPAKIVFLLTLNGRALRQVKRLIKILYHTDHYYYIHVDVRQDYLFRELLPLEKHFHNIRLTRQRFATIWGGASLLQMLLSCMRELLNLDWKWDFVLNLSESDYPVKTVARLVEFLTANKNKNFVKSHGREVQRFIQKQGLDKTFVECDAHMWRIGDRKLPWGIQLDGGSDWVALSRKFVDYVTDSNPDELVEGLLTVFKHTLLPAESFFHTVIRNSIFCNTYIDNNLHVTNWKRKLGCKCQYKHVVDWCGCSPNDFKLDDWARIQNTESRPLFFARKFEPIVNQAVILQVERWLYGSEVMNDFTNLNSYWHNIYSSLDLTTADDALLTLSTSAIRIAIKKIFNKCKPTSFKVREINSFHNNDVYKKTLILFSSDQVQLEVGIKPITTFRIIKSCIITQRLDSFVVSSDYDQKEQIFRNFARYLGPYSEPVLMYHFNSSPYSSATSYNFTILWINPSGNLSEVSDISVDESVSIGHTKLSLKQPLLPGSWTVKLLYKNDTLVETSFLVLPLEFFSNNPISASQAYIINSGNNMYKEFDNLYKKFLPTVNEQEKLQYNSLINSKKIGSTLQDWIDSLFVNFYEVDSICTVNKNSAPCGIKLVNCGETDWSSLAPDPKSFIGEVNKFTGRFDPW